MNLSNVNPRGHDFSAVHAALRKFVDAQLLPGVSVAVLVGGELVDVHAVGFADIEAQVPLRTDHLFRVFSNTKLVTSLAVLMLFEAGQLDLDEPVERHLPQLAQRRVLQPGATSIHDTEPARRPITARHLLSHSAGLSYGLFDPGTTLYKAYFESKVHNPARTLAQMLDGLAALPLAFHPGESWEYSVATDVLARLVEVISAERFDTFIQARILNPLAMVDTGFVLPAAQAHRLVAYYAGADWFDQMKPGLTRTDMAPYPGAYLTPVPRLSGGGGLVSSLGDMLALVRSLLPDGSSMLKPATLAQMMTNQLPAGVWQRFAALGELTGRGHGLAGGLVLARTPMDDPDAVGEFYWGGVAGTLWWISPRANLAAVLMTQRQMAFAHPFVPEVKRLIYEAARQAR